MVPTIMLVGADKGGVGKTMVARALVEYLRTANWTHDVFDTETGAKQGVLKRFVPAAQLVDVATVDGQMQIFDSVADDKVTVVDLRAGTLTLTLRALMNSGVMTDVRSGKVRLTLLHVLGGSVQSAKEVADVMEQMLGADHVLVHNYANPDFTFSEIRSHGTLPVLRIPFLNERSVEAVDNADCPFTQFVTSQASRVLRGYVQTWLDDVFAQFKLLRLA